MERARRAALTALFVALVSSGPVSTRQHLEQASPLVAAPWPTSSLVLSEVMTGGGSASDEFIEIANQGSLGAELQGLEVAYATASGATVTRKATWSSSLVLEPGRRLLLANSLGSYAGVADATYSGGLAATGGALVLRPVGGAPIDAVGWGDATNEFVEGAPALAPPASSSIERQPGGAAGNGTDTNSNDTDWFVQAVPSPQNLASPTVPAPSPTPTPTAEPSPSVTPTPTSTAQPSATPTPTSTAQPSPSAEPTPTPTTTPTATPSPEPTDTIEPSPSPSPSRPPEPTPSVIAIAHARALPDDSTATITGVLTTPLGALEDGRTAFVQDDSGGIAIYLDAPATGTAAAGTTVQVSGSLGDRFAQRTMRASGADIVPLGTAALPEPIAVATGSAGEAVEGQRVGITGLTVGSPTALADGTGLFVDDGTGQLRVIVTPNALGATELPAGTAVRIAGALGQRDSSGTGAEGYRVLVTVAGDLELLPTPTPTVTATPSPDPSAPPTPTMSPSPSLTQTPAPTPTPLTVAQARVLAPGARATVEAVVTAEAGRLGMPELLAIQDATGGIAIRLADGMTSPARGSRIRATGIIADPYGQTELRLSAGGLTPRGTATLPTPHRTGLLTERIEGRLVTVQGVLTGTPRRSSTQDLSFDLRVGDLGIRVMADASAGLEPGSFVRDATYRLTGVVGQRASRRAALDGYRVWLRDIHDVVLVSRPSPSPGPTSSPSGRPGGGIPLVSIARALRQGEGDVAVEGVVTAGARLLDSSGRRIVIQDSSAAVEVLVPLGDRAPQQGSRIRVVGEIGQAYGAPRLRAGDIRKLGRSGMPAPRTLHGLPGASLEWRLVRVTGEVAEVTRLGERWRADLAVGRDRVVIDGLAGSGIPSTMVIEGRRATVTGIVRRPYPTATDRRFSILPRDRGDLRLSAGSGASPQPSSSPGGSPSPSPSPGGTQDTATDVDLADLDLHLGETVRVGGLIVELETDGFVLDDGTGRGLIVLRDAAAEYLPLLDPGDAVNATGLVESQDDRPVVVVRDPAGLARVGDPGPAGADSGRSDEDNDPDSAGGVATGPRTATLVDPLGLGMPGLATLGSLALATLASVAISLLRRERLRRRLAAQVASRVAAVVGGGSEALRVDSRTPGVGAHTTHRTSG